MTAKRTARFELSVAILQKKLGIVSDGFAGPNTFKRLGRCTDKEWKWYRGWHLRQQFETALEKQNKKFLTWFLR